MKIAKIFISLIAALIIANSIFAQQNVKKIDQLMKQYSDYGQFNGSVLVAENGKVIYKKGFGMANLEWNVSNQPDTKFRIASVTKQFTAALVLQLVQEGKIKLEGKITDYLTDYRKDTGGKVTVHELLNHTSGIPDYKNVTSNPYSATEFVKKYMSGDLEFEPGSKYKYNNGGYSILGAIIETVTGKTYETNLQERILKPLGMTNSGYAHNSSVLLKQAGSYEKTPAGYVSAPYIDMAIPYAAGSMYSTVEDLYLWDQSLQQDKILSAESKRLMFTPGLGSYGYGIRITDQPLGKSNQKIKIIWHGGAGVNGFASLVSRAIEKRQTVIVLDNAGNVLNLSKITNSIFAILNGQPFDAPKKSIAETLYKTATEKNIASAIAEYRKLRAENSQTFDFSENELNTLGYQLLNLKRTKDAIEIFNLNAEMFPASANVYDTLGEAYLSDGQKEPALANYKKAIEIDLTNANALQIVKRLEGKETKIDTSGFAAYVGEYQVTPKLILTITKEGDKLFGQLSGQEKLAIEAVSETQFTMPAVKANISFEKDAVGKITGLLLSQGSRTAKAPKVK